MNRFRVATTVLAAVLGAIGAPKTADAQFVGLSFRGAHVYAGGVFPTASDRGASFGAVLWIGTLLDRRLPWGPAIHYSSADRTDAPVTVRDIALAIDAAYPLGSMGRIVPYLGASASLHSADARVSDAVTDPGELATAEAVAADVDGYKLGGAGFGGLVWQLTETGAVGLLAEYRFTVAPDLTRQEARVGIRFSVGGP
jgi:hypothetical protein